MLVGVQMLEALANVQMCRCLWNSQMLVELADVQIMRVILSQHITTMKYLYILITALLLAACSVPTTHSGEGQPVSLSHATLLGMVEADSFVVATVKNPWDTTRTLATYVMVPDSLPMPSHLPQGTVVRTPLRRAVVTSAVHLALLADLDALGGVGGVTDAGYIVSQRIKDYLQRHPNVADMGQSMQPNVERMRMDKVDAVLVSPFENAGHGALDNAGIPLIECADYMETSPLARAEWMRFYGRLFGVGQRADSLFAAVEQAYLACKKRVARGGSGPRPTVMSDLMQRGTWYQPSGRSTMGQFIADAGGRNLWADRTENGSVSLSFESVFQRAAKANVWLVKYGQQTDLSYAQMLRDMPQAAQFAPWQEHRVYACNTFSVPFYEEVPFHPERLLQNLADIFGGRTPQGSDVYYTPVKQ